MIFDLSHPLDPKKRLGDSADWDSPYSWPVRREFSRILHRPRPHVGIVYTERFLNSRPLTYFDDETKIIRARAGALLKQVHAPLPKPSKILRPYETLDSYTSHQLMPYGVPQHVYHQSYFSEPAHLTIGRGHLACIQYAGGKGYPRRKHLYSDENRNIRDEIKFRSYYNRPKNEDPNTLPTGFAWRLLHLPPKDDKPFKIYKHSRTLPLVDSKKDEKEKTESEDNVKGSSSHKKYQRNFTGPTEDLPKYEKRKTIQSTKQDSYEKISDKYKKNEEEKHSTVTAPIEEASTKLLSNEVTDVDLNEKTEPDCHDKHPIETHPIIEEQHVPSRKNSKQPLNRTKSLVSKQDSIAENTENIAQKTSKSKEDVKLEDEIQKQALSEPAIVKTDDITTEQNQKQEPPSKPEITTEEADKEVIQEENISEVVTVLPEEEVKIDEVTKEIDVTDETKPAANEPDNVSTEVINEVTEEKIIEPTTEEPLEQKIPDELSVCEQENTSVTEKMNVLETTDTLVEAPLQQDADENKVDSDQLNVKEEEILQTSNITTDVPKEDETSLDVQEEQPLEESSKILDNEDIIKTETTTQEEESNVIVELNDSEGQNKWNDSTVTITESHDESGVTISQIHEEVTEISYSERNGTFHSRDETVIQAFSSTQNSEALAESDKPETSTDMVNETDITTDEENLESPVE